MISLPVKLITGCVAISCCSAVACSKKDNTERKRVKPPAAFETQNPSSAPVWVVSDTGSAQFFMDAPLERTKGTAGHFSGNVWLDTTDLSATRGEVNVDLDTLKTSTFDDQQKNIGQSEHAHNWLELGKDVYPKLRAENQWARFVIRNVREPTSNNVALAAQVSGHPTVELTAEGDFWLHGVTAKKIVRLSAIFEGPATAPTRVTIRTVRPVELSLKEHDIKPRDVAGKLLSLDFAHY